MQETRRKSVVSVLDRLALDALLIRGMQNILYLTGFKGSEGSLLVTRGDCVLMTDSRYILHAMEVAEGITVLETRENDGTLSTLNNRYGVHRLGFDSLYTTYRMYQRYLEWLAGLELVPVEKELEEIRRCKDDSEMAVIRKGLEIATQAFNRTFEKMVPGSTEREIANELDYAMRSLGAEAPAFETIVASGPRAALPHARPTDRSFQEGDLVIIDFGCLCDGYNTDETVTLCVGEPSSELHEIHAIVNDARKKGIEAARAGVLVRDVDAVVRGHIEERGYGQYFRHGTGHGVGVDVHEAPAITPRTEGMLEENMVVTIEPGIYLPHVGGVRLEDMIVIREGQAEVLTSLRKDLLKIRGR
jgi:Xaa-Pro aminopeptidase